MRRRVNRPLWLGARWLAKQLLRLPVRWATGFRVHGRQRLPSRRAPLIVAANHAAWIDTLYLVLALRPRFTVCGAKPPYFATAPRRVLMTLANIEEVVDRESFVTSCAELLDAGEIVLIYPEMGRNPDGLGELRTWLAEVALASQVPILPCFIDGTGASPNRPALFVGERIPATGDALSLTEELRRAIGGLAPSGSRRGVTA